MSDDVQEEIRGGLGQLDLNALRTIRDIFLEDEPLIDSAGFDDPLNPRKLVIELEDGVTSEGTFTIRFTERGYYTIHYSEDEIDFRFDHHENDHSPRRHFHPPPEASQDDAEPSCIEVEYDELVARAVHKLWRRWYESDGDQDPNDVEHPP